MSHPDPCYDPENSYEDDEMFTEPDESDVPFVEYLYDDHNDFYGDKEEVYEMDGVECGHEDGFEEDDEKDVWGDDYDDSMDGDFDSAMRDAGFGTDEDYGYYGEDY